MCEMLGCSVARKQRALLLLAVPQRRKRCAPPTQIRLQRPYVSLYFCCCICTVPCCRHIREISVQELAAIAKAAVTSGSLSALGDILAQLLVKTQLKRSDNIDKQFELERTARMFSFGLLLYGAHQQPSHTPHPTPRRISHPSYTHENVCRTVSALLV